MTKEFFDAIKRGDKEEVERRVMQDPSLIHLRKCFEIPFWGLLFFPFEPISP